MNKLETRLEATGHLYKPLGVRSDLDLSWWEHALNNNIKKIKLSVPHGLGCWLGPRRHRQSTIGSDCWDLGLLAGCILWQVKVSQFPLI